MEEGEGLRRSDESTLPLSPLKVAEKSASSSSSLVNLDSRSNAVLTPPAKQSSGNKPVSSSSKKRGFAGAEKEIERLLVDNIFPSTSKRQKRDVEKFTYEAASASDSAAAMRKRVLSGKKKLIEQEAAHLARIEKLNKEKNAFEKKLGEFKGKVKFPVKDEDVAMFDKGKPALPLPAPKGIIALPADQVSDALSVWEFLNSFKKQLHLSMLRIEDFVDLIRYTKKASVGLTEVFLAPCRMILADPHLCHSLSISVPKKMNFSRQLSSAMAKIQSMHRTPSLQSFSGGSTSDEAIAGYHSASDADFDTGYSGLRLLPTRLGPAMLDGLRLPGVLRAIILRLTSVKRMRKSVADNEKLLLNTLKDKRDTDAAVNSSSKKQALQPTVLTIEEFGITGVRKEGKKSVGDVDCLLSVTSITSRELDLLKAAAMSLETLELHELHPRHKLALLKSLCEMCYETVELSTLIQYNMEQRADKITEMRRQDKLKAEEKKQVSNAKREEAIEICREMNKEAAEAAEAKLAAAATRAEAAAKKKAAAGGSPSEGKKGGAKKKSSLSSAAASSDDPAKGKKGGRGKQKDHPYFPKQDQINSVLEELVLLESLGIHKVVDALPLEELSDSDGGDDGDEDAQVSIKQRGPSSRTDSAARAKARQEKKYRNSQIVVAEDLLTRALETQAEKDVRQALKIAARSGLKFEDEDTGEVCCTELMKEVYRVDRDIKSKAEDAKLQLQHENALSEFVVASKCLGVDRHYKRYWVFSGDDRLFVQERVTANPNPNPAPEGKSKKSKAAMKVEVATPATLHSTVLISDQYNTSVSLGDSFSKLYNFRPNTYFYKWGIYSNQRDLWELCEALDDRGIREQALLSAIKTQFDLSEPPIAYQLDHEWVGRKVKRTFGKKKVIGKIVGWLPRQGADIALWHVEHLDGDEEDLEEYEVEKFIISLSEAELCMPGSGQAQGLPEKRSRVDRKGDASTHGLPSKSNSSNNLGNVGLADEDDSSLHDEPLIISAYSNHASRYLYSIKNNQLGLTGLRNELFALNTFLAEGLKRRDKNAYNRDFRKSWERGVHDASCIEDFRKCLVDLEDIVHFVQTEPDRDDDEEIANSKRANYNFLTKEGWIFDKDVSPHIGKFGRRFFYGHGLSNGVVTAFLPAERNEGLDIWHMEHSDGDVEDLDESDILKAMAHYDADAMEPFDEADIIGRPAEAEEEDSAEAVEEEEEEIDEQAGLVFYHADPPLKQEWTDFLWPTSGVRSRWLDALLQAKTIAEVALAISAFSEYATIFGVVAEDPSDSLVIGSSSKKMLYCSSLHARKAGGPAKQKGGRKTRDEADDDRPRRATAVKVNYRESD